MKPRWHILVVTTIALLLTSACGSQLPFDVSLAPTLTPDPASNEFTLASFAHRVADAGIDVRLVGGVRQPFLSVDGHVIDIEGERVQVYEYRAAEDAEAAAARVTPDGSAVSVDDTPMPVDWVSTPHFYQRDRLLVVYVGEEDTVLDVLDGTLGMPFAGPGTVLPTSQ